MSLNYNIEKTLAKPFFKWAGGKGQLLDQFEKLYPKDLLNGNIKHYYEPFLGGGAVFFDLAQRFEFESIWLYDINPELILTYTVVQRDVNDLIKLLSIHEQQYLSFDKDDRKEYYYQVRNEFNSNRVKINYLRYNNIWIERAAQLIFMNKTCYNGLFRFNSSGGFNSPAGAYKNPTICNELNLLQASNLLQRANIKCIGYETVLEDIQNNSFIYFDPPYRPISSTSNFKSYSKHDFTDKDQIQLAKVFTELDKKNCKVMLSNSDPKNNNSTDDFFDQLYKDYKIRRIPARRSINSKASKRGAIKEIVVTNY